MFSPPRRIASVAVRCPRPQVAVAGLIADRSEASFTFGAGAEASALNTLRPRRVCKGVERIATITSTTFDVPLEARAAERLGELFDAHQARLYALALRMARDPEEARDLLQETFLRAARRVRSIPTQDRAAEAWLTQVLVNLCRDRWRRLKVRREAGPMPLWSADTPLDPETMEGARRAVRDALATLKPRTRAIVVLHEMEGRARSEIASLLNMREVTVRWHLSTGRNQLRRLLTKEDDER
jgi:RNA polymerase sigma-70 factor (ECF subfamily)